MDEAHHYAKWTQPAYIFAPMVTLQTTIRVCLVESLESTCVDRNAFRIDVA